jgi:sulfite reductase (ferredoxin)
LVLAGNGETGASYDVYVAGGLGREPQPAFLFEKKVGENRIIPLIEAIARVYAAHAPAGKRIKHLIRDMGETEFRRLVALEPSYREELPGVGGLPENLAPVAGTRRIVAPVRSGELLSEQLQALAGFSEQFAGGILMVTTDQDIAFHVDAALDQSEAGKALALLGFGDQQPIFRVCPGSHQCLVGLSPTRDVSRSVIEAMGPVAEKLTWALSGCPNSCTQPQLADAGIISTSLAKDVNGERSPRFDLLRLGSEGFGTVVEKNMTLETLCNKVQEIG